MSLKISYIVLALAITLVLIFFDLKGSNSTFYKTRFRFLHILCGWHVYIISLSLTGYIENLNFPPRFFLLTIFPAFVLIGFLSTKIKNSPWLINIPPHWLIFYQSFRIVIEVIFVFTVGEGILHRNVTMEGYNYDIVYAFTAIIIGLCIAANFKRYRKLALVWNYMGLGVILIIIFLFQSTIYVPEIYGPNTLPFPVEFMKYPYILVPAFLMPSAVLVHVMSIIQLRMDGTRWL